MQHQWILIPVRGSGDEETIAYISDRERWALVEIGSGKIQDITYHEDRMQIEQFIDSVIVRDKNDEVADFFAESIPVLEAPVQRTIEDIIEAYMFKELYEVPIQF